MESKTRYYPEFESLRGLAAALVVCNHLPAWNPAIYEFSLFRRGGLMVDLFFVLSGFVIHSTYNRRIGSWRDLGAFQLLRFGRLYPVHLLFLLLYLVIEGARMFGAHAGAASNPNAGITHPASWSAFFQHVFLLQGILPLGDIQTFNAPSWSISVEFYVYLLFALVTLLVRPRGWRLYAAIHVVAASMVAFGIAQDFMWFLRGISGFALGCAVSAFTKTSSVRVHGGVAELILCAMAAAVWFYIPNQLAYVVVSWLTAGLLLSVALQGDWRGPLVAFLKHPWLLFLGSLSYTIYMSHGAVFWFTNQVARFGLKWPDRLVEGTYKPQAGLLQASLFSIASFLLVLVVAWTVTRYVEIPARDYFRRLSRRTADNHAIGVQQSAASGNSIL